MEEIKKLIFRGYVGDKELSLISGCDGLWLSLVAKFLYGMCLSWS